MRPTTTVAQRDAEVEEDDGRFFLHMTEADIYLPQALCSQSESNIRRRPQPRACSAGVTALIEAIETEQKATPDVQKK